jgi:hypothetical protein
VAKPGERCPNEAQVIGGVVAVPTVLKVLGDGAGRHAVELTVEVRVDLSAHAAVGKASHAEGTRSPPSLFRQFTGDG